MKGALRIYFQGVASSAAGLVAGHFFWRKEEDDQTFEHKIPVMAVIALAWPAVIPPVLAMEVDSFITGSRWNFTVRRNVTREITEPSAVGDVKATGGKQ